jgi:Bacterial regulatory proteins, gntR family/Phage integrase, N-terminal SAM-like domain
VPSVQLVRSGRFSGLLLIRGFGVQVPGGAPVLTWFFSALAALSGRCVMPRTGTGHLEQLPSGSYRVNVYSGIDPLTGRQLRHRQTVKTKGQARIVLGRLLEQAAAGQRPTTDVKVAEVFEQYMSVAELEPSTRETYEGYIRRTILPALGAVELRKVRGPVLDTFYARLRRCGDPMCTGRPFTEHGRFPALEVKPGDRYGGWLQVTATIREAIESGQLARGEQIPSVRELAAAHGLPVATLRRAVDTLADEGAIVVRQGRRSVVSGEPGEVPSRRTRPDDPGHDCARAGCVQHRCKPMSAATIRQIHSILSGAFVAAVRWEWIDRNPAASAKLPKARHRSPTSPSPATGQISRNIPGQEGGSKLRRRVGPCCGSRGISGRGRLDQRSGHPLASKTAIGSR